MAKAKKPAKPVARTKTKAKPAAKKSVVKAKQPAGQVIQPVMVAMEPTYNGFLIGAILMLALTMVLAGTFYSQRYIVPGYLALTIAGVLAFTGIFSKQHRISTGQTDAVLKLSALMLLLTNLWVVVSAHLVMYGNYHIDYVNFWQGWPVLPLSLLLIVALLATKRHKHRWMVYLSIVVLLAGLAIDRLLSA